MSLKITVEIERAAFQDRVDGDDLIRTRVLIDGKRDLHMERLWSRDEFHSYFDKVWCYMGQEIKQMNFDLEFNNGN